MKNENYSLYKIMQHFEGMQKIEVFDLLHKMEILLFYTSSPITKDSIIQIINSGLDGSRDVDPFQFTVLPNGNFCEFIGSNDWLHIYQENKRGWMKWSPFTTYYFKTKYAPLELLPLTKKKLLENLENTPEVSKVVIFLKQHRVSKKNKKTDRLLLLDL
ncbi:hypothetical protein [Aquimarina sp. MMG016]|uniref:hypothetical protein n=1 Tax=Aquimarina sp. MMG016 TaxID=2822690 RepID=UPI001B3A343C|nr:hypothetical protein [Aquimarina sp. MMG016]MBQ4818859.1 hypothetical protein [Aquimarina sp. MMG016]